MKKLDFREIDSKTFDLRKKNFQISYKIVLFIFILFFAKFYFEYKYFHLLYLFISLFILNASSYFIVLKYTKNTVCAIAAFYTSVYITSAFLVFLSGGFNAPGVVWYAILPFLGTSLLGRRGFNLGIILTILILIFISTTTLMGIEMFPFTSLDQYQFTVKINLIAFTLSSYYYAYNHTKNEEASLQNIKNEKEKNENLLRILFHDLANPMQTIRLAVKKALSNRGPEDMARALNQLDKTSLRIVEILDHIRQLKGLEDKKIKIDLKPHNVYELVHSVVENFDYKIREKNVTVEIKNHSNDPSVVIVDKLYFLNQILGNIISNALKFSINEGSIIIVWEKISNFIEISISDNGVGMPKEILDNIFDQSKQTTRIGTSGEVGTGYGMPLVRTFIEQFNGMIEINSIEKSDNSTHSGTTIKLILPSA